MPKKTFESAEDAKAILITQVKNNQPSLLNQIELGCSICKPTAVIENDLDKEHGRIEQLPMLNKWQDEWPFLRKIIRVTKVIEGFSSTPTSSLTFVTLMIFLRKGESFHINIAAQRSLFISLKTSF
ncbi:hypothetical protein FACS189449_10690 [Alphaproteobacteria bacterium]|nr:hypothetical protein FACS189449_10690 [Alphaproteobacteria bacterium]